MFPTPPMGDRICTRNSKKSSYNRQFKLGEHIPPLRWTKQHCRQQEKGQACWFGFPCQTHSSFDGGELPSNEHFRSASTEARRRACKFRPSNRPARTPWRANHGTADKQYASVLRSPNLSDSTTGLIEENWSR